MRDHLGALYRLSEIYSENIQYVRPINCIALANKLYESAQFYQKIPGLENRAHVKKLYELAARFGHVEAREQLFFLNIENQIFLSLSLADTKQETPATKVDARTEESKSANPKPIYTEDKTPKGKENQFPNTMAINRFGVLSNANKPNFEIPCGPLESNISQLGC